MGGVVREALEDALDGDGLIDNFESFSSTSLATFPLTWTAERHFSKMSDHYTNLPRPSDSLCAPGVRLEPVKCWASAAVCGLQAAGDRASLTVRVGSISWVSILLLWQVTALLPATSDTSTISQRLLLSPTILFRETVPTVSKLTNSSNEWVTREDAWHLIRPSQQKNYGEFR